MMDKVIARKVLRILNNKELHDILVDYANYRIDDLKEKLTFANVDEVRGLQASIRELKRFETLRDEALKAGDHNG